MVTVATVVLMVTVVTGGEKIQVHWKVMEREMEIIMEIIMKRIKGKMLVKQKQQTQQKLLKLKLFQRKKMHGLY